MIKRGTLAITLWALVLAPSSGRAEAGRTALSFLQKPLDAHAVGMGGAVVSLSGRLGALQHNPAGLAALTRPSLLAAYMSGLSSGQYGFLAYAQPLGRRQNADGPPPPSRSGHSKGLFGVLAAGIQYYNAGTIELNLSDGSRGTVTAEEDIAPVVAYAVEPVPGVGVGGSFKQVRSSLAGGAAKATGHLWDLGSVWRTPLRGLSAGAAYLNLGPDITYESTGDPPPRTLRYGLSYKTRTFEARTIDPGVQAAKVDFLFAVESIDVLHEERSPRIGFEMGLTPHFLNRFALRTGWQFNRAVESFSFGMGIVEGRLAFDYGFAPAQGLSNTHQFTLTVAF